MPKMIQVRHVPDRLHQELKRRASRRGIPLTRYIQEILEKEVARPPADEIVDRIAARPRIDLRQTAAEMLRQERQRGGRS